MDDYIFLIIAVAISIFAAINKSKKKKMDDNPLEEEEAKPRNFFMDQLLGEDFLEEPEKENAQPVQTMQAPAKVVFKSSNDVKKVLNYQLPRFKSTLPVRPKRESISTFQRSNEEEEIVGSEESTNYLEDFSLAKAFVYSQIMERKY